MPAFILSTLHCNGSFIGPGESKNLRAAEYVAKGADDDGDWASLVDRTELESVLFPRAEPFLQPLLPPELDPFG